MHTLQSIIQVFTNRSTPVKHEEYISLCQWMDSTKDCACSSELYDLLAIAEFEHKAYTIEALQHIREDEDIPNTRFWWWIDTLQAQQLK